MDDKNDYTKPDAYMKEAVARESYEDFIKKEMAHKRAAMPMELPNPTAQSNGKALQAKMEAALREATPNKEVHDVVMRFVMGMMLSTLMPGELGKDLLVTFMGDAARDISALVDKASASK